MFRHLRRIKTFKTKEISGNVVDVKFCGVTQVLLKNTVEYLTKSCFL